MRPHIININYNYNYNYINNTQLLLGSRRSRSIKFSYTHKFNYTRAAAAADNDDVIQQQDRAPNLLHLEDYKNNPTSSPHASFNLIDQGNNETNSLNFQKPHNSKQGSPRIRGKRQTMNRSSILAKQVITIHSAITLGFVSQLWLDTTSWLVLVVELRPNLLSAQAERFLLHDIYRVGDVVLVQDESLTENDIDMVGLETLVGYNVVTPGRQNIGKVRGFNFNVNSGAVVSLELDSFGISIIPSSLVSTYALFVEDVLEVVSDTVIVHEAAASRIQRLTKGFWDALRATNSMDEFSGFSDLENSVQPEYGQRRRRNSTSENLQSKVGEMDVDWELPMDYL